MDEAKRCLDCKHSPCITKCPVQIQIPAFIQKVAEGDFESAYQIISQDSSLPATVCGRVCPQETQCESVCVRGIKGEPEGIGRLGGSWPTGTTPTADEAVVPDTSNGHKVAVIGSAPPDFYTRATWLKRAMRSQYLKPFTWRAECWSTASLIPLTQVHCAKREVDYPKGAGVKIETNIWSSRSGHHHDDELKTSLALRPCLSAPAREPPQIYEHSGENPYLKGSTQLTSFSPALA